MQRNRKMGLGAWFALAILVAAGLSGCAADTAIIEYKQMKHTVKLGDSINQALPILNQMQSTVPASWLKPADQFLKDGKKYYLHFQRTGHKPTPKSDLFPARTPTHRVNSRELVVSAQKLVVWTGFVVVLVVSR